MIVRRLIPAGVVALCSMVGLLVGSPLALAAKSHGFSSSFGVFISARGVAVDDSAGVSKGDVYAVDQGAPAVDRFTATQAAHEEPGVTLTGVSFVSPTGVAVDDSGSASAGEVYVADPGAGVVDRFSGATGKFLSRIDGSETPDAGVRGFEPVGVAVDPTNGEVFVADAHNDLVDVFSPGGVYVSQFAAGVSSALTGVAVNKEGDVYVTAAGGEALELLAEGGYTSVMPVGAGVSAVSVDPVSGNLYLDEGSSIVELNASGESLGNFGSGSLEGSTGVGVDSVSGTVYASDGTSAAIFPEGQTPGEPATGAATGVNASEATLHGELAGGQSGYYFAYNQGSSCTGGASTQPTAAGGSVEATATLSGLQPATGYIVCLVATNAYGQTQGSAVSFTTAAVPATIEGESFSGAGLTNVTLSTQIDPNGSSSSYYWEYGQSATYGSRTPEVSLGEGQSALPASAQLEGLAANSEYHFRVVAVNAAGTEHGADTAFRTLPTTPLGLPDGRAYEMVSSFGSAQNGTAQVYIPKVYGTELALAEGIFTKLPFQVAAHGEAAAYAGDPSSGGSGRGGQSSGNEYLATRLPGGGWRQVNIQPHGKFGAQYQGFSSDLTSAVLTASSETGLEDGLPPLSPEAPSDGYTDLFQHAFSSEAYEPFFTDGVTLHRPAEGSYGVEGLEVVYAGASADSSEQLFEVNDALTPNASELAEPNSILQVPEGNLYVTVGGHLSLVNVLPDGATDPQVTFGSLVGSNHPYSGEVNLSHVISTDGSRVFWADWATGGLYMRENPTSSDAKTVEIAAGGHFWTASADGSKVFYTNGGLYEYEVERGLTTDLTPGVEVVGVVGASEDGDYLYYVTGSDNLYLWHAGASILLAANLSSEDSGSNSSGPIPPYGANGGIDNPEVGDWAGEIGERTSEVTPGGGAVVFMSNRSLPVVGYPRGYPNEGQEEVYVYEAEGGGLFCVSCSRSGEAPPVTADDGAAAFLPVSWMTTERPQVISDDGSRVFFDSWEPLVSQDTNGKLDVYEWERDGAGSCREGQGCVYLLSGGTSSSSSWFLGASTSGDDAFVISRADLTGTAGYEGFAVYDARVGGVQPVASPVCTGSGCQGVPPAAPIFATPASVTFAGVGNFPAPSTTAPSKSKPRSKGGAGSKSVRARRLAGALRTCERRRGRARSVCVARARRRYGSGLGAGKSSLRVGGR